MKSFKPVTHVIFDMDGLILDTEAIFRTSTQQALEKYGKQFTWDVNLKLMGKTTQECAAIIVNDLQLPVTVEEFTRNTRKMYEEAYPKAKLLPGVEKLVRHLHSCKIPIAVATGSNANSFRLKTRNHGQLFKLFHHTVIIGSDPEVKNGKPSPDPFLICASRFTEKPTSENVLVLEDAPNGVAAALAAGMQVVMVPDPRVDKELTKKATQILTSLEEFKPEHFGLPAYIV